MNSRAFLLVGSIVCLAVTLGMPSPTKAQWEAAEVAKMYKACTDSGGTAASNYNAWVAQNGCICPGSSVGSGQVTCSGGSGSATTSAVPPNLSLTPQQQLGMQIGMVGANMIGQGLHQLLFGAPPSPPDPAEQQRQLAARQLNNSGIYLFRQKNYAGAINEFQKALAITPNDQNILHNLALAKRRLKDVAVAGQTSGALGQLLDSAPVGAGTLNSGQTAHSRAPSSDAALNLVNLDSDPSVVDLRATTKTNVDPVGTQETLRSLDDVLGNAPDAEARRQLDDFADANLSQNLESNSGQSAGDAQPEIQNPRSNAEQTTEEIDQAIGQNQSLDTQQSSAPVEPGSGLVTGSANSAGPQPNSHLLDGVGNPDFDGATTGNASIHKGNPNPENESSDAVDLRNTGTTDVDPSRVAGSSPALQSTNPSDADKALMKHQWEMSIDSRYKNDPEVQQSIQDLWTAARSGDDDANEKLKGILSDQLRAAGQTPEQRADFFENFNAIASGEGPTPKEWSKVSQLADEMDTAGGSLPPTGAASAELPPYYGQLVKDIGKAESITASASYMGTGRQTQDDCVLYAIANGAHVPEKQVNAEFSNIVSHLGMDPIAERTNPETVVMEPQNGGRGGVGAAEELLLADKFGKVIPVPTESYARAIASTKQPVITTVELDKTGVQHKVVVTGVYRTADGKIYYSVMDSNLGPGYNNSTAYVEKSNFEEHLASGGFVVMPAAN
ncbi:MAG TPA: tetratricopeptide repeat protein [Candidatus Acidoferrales bacterium]|nr:tetratricopeptide repeat protein [Candidatus Acidoferrales bacterium]